MSLQAPRTYCNAMTNRPIVFTKKNSTLEINIESARSIPLTMLSRSFCSGISSCRGSGFLFLRCGVGVLVACKLGPSALLWHASSLIAFITFTNALQEHV